MVTRYSSLRIAWSMALIVLVLGLVSSERVLASGEAGLGLAPAASPGPALGSIAAGYSHSCAISTDGTLTCWGDNAYGQSTPPAGTFTQVAAGYSFTCGLKTDGTLACWGFNASCQRTPPAGSFTQVAAGYLHACGL